MIAGKLCAGQRTCDGRNRVLVLIQWAWSYLTFSRGARLIVSKKWRSYAPPGEAELPSPSSDGEASSVPAESAPAAESARSTAST